MKQFQVELPDKLAEELQALVRGGWFQDEHEILRLALLEFLRHRRLELVEEHQREDIASAAGQTAGREARRCERTVVL